MIEQIRQYCSKNLELPPKASILVACSGGSDSMVMADILHHLEYKVSIAHCNFQLRGNESLEDQKCVALFAKKLGCKFHLQAFETEQESKIRKTGIQETARDLRYHWFEKLRIEENLDFIATAHHKDDNQETILFQLIRGTGLMGMSGIPPKNGKIIRPMLDVGKSEILGYASEHKIPFREDKSNLSNKYSRNKIRNEILPLMAEINPLFADHLEHTSKLISEAKALVDSILKLDSSSEISVDDIKTSPYPSLILWNWLEPRGFSPGEVAMVADLIDKQVGKFVASGEFQVTRDREKLVLSESADTETAVVIIEEPPFKITDPIHLEGRVVESGEIDFNMGTNVAWLDVSNIQWPMTLRLWRAGDRFQPLGMHGQQKLSDFLIHQKVSRPDKEKVYVLESDQRIIWVVGMRIDERVKVVGEGRCLRLVVHKER